MIYFQLGTIGGNLMIKKQIPGFQSDIYLFLETIGGEMTISKSTYYVSFTKIHATVRNTILFPFFSP